MAENSDDNRHEGLLLAVKDDDCVGITAILNTGYDVNAADPESKETPVMESCRSLSLKALELLIKRGGNPNHKNKSGRTPLHVCQENRSIECIKILLQTPHIDIDVQDNFGATPLMLACHRGFKEGVVMMSDHGCNLELKNQFGWTALHYCVTEFEKQIGQSKVLCLQELVSRGANMNVRSKGGYSPLHTAVQMGHYDSVRVLVHENCNTDIDAQEPVDSSNCQEATEPNDQASSAQSKPEQDQSKQPTVGRLAVAPRQFNPTNRSVKSNPPVRANPVNVEGPIVSAGASVQSKPSIQTSQPMKGRSLPMKPSAEPAKAQPTLPMTPLAMALFFGHMAIVELLLQHDSTTSGLMEITTQVQTMSPFLREALGLRSLKQLSRKSVRKALGQQITSKVGRLGLKPSLTKFILCEEGV